MMGWFTRDRRPVAPAAEIAAPLYQILVAPEGEAGHPAQFQMPEPL